MTVEPLRREFRLHREPGCSLHVVEWGPAVADVTVILTHGWSMSHLTWEDVAELLASANPQLRVIAYDHRGHGKSARVHATLELLADDLRAVIEELVPTGSVVLGGHSMGGMTMMALAERAPEIIRDRCVGAAFIATSSGGLPAMVRPLLRIEWMRAAGLWAIAHAPQPTRPLVLVRQFGRFGMFGLSGVFPTRHDLNRLVWQGAAAHRPAVSDMGKALYEHDRYHTLAVFSEVETVIMAGTWDALTPAAHSRVLAKGLPHARLLEIARAGHQLPYECRAQVAKQLLILTERARGKVAVA